MNSPPLAAGRIAVLSPLVIDQIAAGEVVERPASVIKELVDNSIDAGSTRIDVELEDGGLTRISVRDNGRGIHPDDLPLAVTRHATSKLRDATELADIRTLGFRGEALASVAAVARLDIRSRITGATVGTHLHSIPGQPPTLVPSGMPFGTQIEVHALFANIPARRKFMRAEATEVGQCSETLLRLAIVRPDIHFTLRHGKRELLNLPRASAEERVAQVLGRRVSGPFFAFAGEEDGVRVHAFLPHPSAAARGRGSPYLITRGRVVRERNLAQILAQAYGLSGEAPSACLFVEPPPGAVDVNVHPQKAEVRFSEPQQVFAAVRRVLAAAVAGAPWAGEIARAEPTGPIAQVVTDMSPRTGPRGTSAPVGFTAAPERPASRVASPGAGPSVLDPEHPSAADLAAAPAARGREPDHATGAGREAPSAEPGRAPAAPAIAASTPATPRPTREPAHEAAAGRPPRPDPDASGPALRRVEQAAAAAAAQRRAEAEAWLARAEASIDRGLDLDLAETREGPLARTPRPPATASPVPAEPAAEPWDLDLGDAAPVPGPAAGPDAGRHETSTPLSDSPSGMSSKTGPSRAGEGPSEMSSGPNSSLDDPGAGRRSARATAGGPASPASGTGAVRPPSSPAGRSDAPPGSPPDPDDPAMSEDTSAWLTRAGATAAAAAAALADAARARAAAWLERAGAEPSDPEGGEIPLLRWSERQPDLVDLASPPDQVPEDRPQQGYRLSTRALGPDYDRHKRSMIEAASALRPVDPAARAGEPRAQRPPAPGESALFAPDELRGGDDEPAPRDMREGTGPQGQPGRPDPPALLACLPGPVAVFADREALLAVDLRRVRSHLVYLRLQRDLLGRRAVAVQGLLTPAIVRRPQADVALLTAAQAELRDLGVDIDAFGDDAVVVRGVPAHLRHCVDDADASDLVARIVPWLRIRAGDGDRAARERGLLDAIATTRGGDPAPRLARRWLAELLEAGGSLESVPGIRRWTASALLGGS